MKKLWRIFAKDERGQLLMIAMAILGLGAIIVVPAMTYVNASFRSVGNAAERTDERYAAEAAIEAVVADLRQGVDVLDGGYVPPVVVVNDITPVVTAFAPATAFPRIFVFADPNTTTDLAPLAPATSFLYVVHGVIADTKIEFNWNYTPAAPSGGPDTRIEIFNGVSTDTIDRLKNNTDNNSPHTLTMGSGINDGGSFTFRFTNESVTPLTSSAFGEEGELGLTWMSMKAGVDVIVTAEAGDTVLQAYLQQGPGGATGAERTAAILAWVQPENYFSDLQAGGPSSGWVLDDGGLTVDIVDLADPTGFSIGVSGAGGGTAKLVVCGSLLLLTDGDSLVVTCGSLMMEVLTGTVQVLSSPEVTINVFEGTLTTITDLSEPIVVIVKVENDPESPEMPITADVTTSTGIVVVGVPASATVIIRQPTSGGIIVEQPLGSTGVTVDLGDGEVTLPSGGEIEVEPPPPAGLKGTKELTIAELNPHTDESSRIAKAMNEIEKSIADSLWEDEFTLDAKNGKDVFKAEKKAVDELEKAIDKDDLSTEAQGVVESVIEDLVEVDRDLALAALDLSLETVTLDPKNENKVEDKQQDAQEELEKGGEDRDAGKPRKAIDHYKKAWEDAQDAMKLQAKEPKDDDDDEDDGDDDGDDDDGDDDDDDDNGDDGDDDDDD